MVCAWVSDKALETVSEYYRTHQLVLVADNARSGGREAPCGLAAFVVASEEGKFFEDHCELVTIERGVDSSAITD